MSDIKKIIKEQNPRAMFLSPLFDSALIGTSKTCGHLEVAAYSTDECLKILINRQNMDELEALEYFQGSINSGKFNQFKPVFINDFRKIRILPEALIKHINKGEGTIDELSNFLD